MQKYLALTSIILPLPKFPVDYSLVKNVRDFHAKLLYFFQYFIKFGRTTTSSM